MMTYLHHYSGIVRHVVQKIVDKLDYLPKRVQHQVKRQTDQVWLSLHT